MSGHRRRAVVLSAALLIPATALGAKQPLLNLVPDGGIERGTADWNGVETGSAGRTAVTAKTGRFALLVRNRRARGFGASIVVPQQTLRDRRFLSLVTGALRGRFELSVWVRGGRGTVGRRLRVQLNEYGGATPESTLRRGERRIRLGRRWQRAIVRGVPRSLDRTGLLVLLATDAGKPGDRFYVDDVRLGGDPLGQVSVERRGRWRWWSYALVWTAVLAAGTLSLAVPRRRAQSARSLAP